MGSGDHDYLAREARARIEIDRQLLAAGWVVQSQDALNLSAGPGIAVRESTLDKPGEYVGYRDRQTRKVRWDAVDEPVEYAAAQLDRAVVAEDQIRTVIQAFKDRLFTELFPGRTTVPKTLIFAKDDSHTDDIVQVAREVFGKGNQFATKITYRTHDGKAENLLQAFRNSMYPRIVVTVDMIATGTDVKPLECLVFMRSVKSRTYFEQMLGRGVRVIDNTEFQSVTGDAKRKDRFVVVDAVGVMDSPLAENVQPLERKTGLSLKDILNQVAFGNRDPQVASSLAGRLARLDKRLTKDDRAMLTGLAGRRQGFPCYTATQSNGISSSKASLPVIGYGDTIDARRAKRIIKAFRLPLLFVQVHTAGFYD